MKNIIDGFGEALAELGKLRDDVIVLSTDTAIKTGVKSFAEAHPDRFIKSGKAEQAILGAAMGLSHERKIPFVSTCAALGKNWDQLKTTCYDNVNVKIADAHDEAREDIALARVLPNITIIVPADYHEAKKSIIAAATMKGPVYIRLGRQKAPVTDQKTEFTLGRAEIIRAGKDCTIVGCGPILHEALQAAEKLAKQEIECTVLDCHTVQPIDKHAIIGSARITGCVVTAEEHSIKGGLGSSVAEVLSENLPVPLRMIRGEKDTVIQIVKAVKEAVLQRSENICTAIPEEHGTQLYTELHPEVYFRLRGGGIIRSIPGLHKALLEMNDSTFHYHCNKHKNDFSTWVKDVFRENLLAKELNEKHTRLGMVSVLARWLK